MQRDLKILSRQNLCVSYVQNVLSLTFDLVTQKTPTLRASSYSIILDSFDHKTNRGLKSKWTTLCIPVNIQSSFTYHGSYSHLIFCGVPKLVQNCMSVIGLSLRYCGKHLIYWLISRQVWQLTLWPQNWKESSTRCRITQVPSVPSLMSVQQRAFKILKG